MSKVFRITPKRVKRSNGQVLTPDMSITVMTRSHTTTPFYNGAVEIKEQYMRMYQFDTRKHVAHQVILNLRSWTKIINYITFK